MAEVATRPEQLLGCLFGAGESICSEVCFEVAQSICEEFGQLGTPSHEDLKRQAQLFETVLGYPMCIGARDGSHIPIRGSFARISWCFKGFYSLVLQIVTGADYRILAATMGQEILMTQQS